MAESARNETIIKAGISGSIKLGGRKAFQWIFRIYATIRGLGSGQISLGNVSGVIGIGYITYAAAKRGIGMLLYFLAILSVNLGIVNLLPIPVFDGGHLVFAAIEKVRGKAVSARIQGMANYLGLAIILALVALTFWNDIRMLIPS